MRKEVTCLCGTGFKDLILASFTEEKEFLHLLWMKLWFRQVANMLGYGLQLTSSQISTWYLHSEVRKFL